MPLSGTSVNKDRLKLQLYSLLEKPYEPHSSRGLTNGYKYVTSSCILRRACYDGYVQFAFTAAQKDHRPKEAKVTNRQRYTESAAELSTPLSVLYSVVEDAQRYADYLKENAQGIYDQELADFLDELRDETNRRAKRAEELLAQRLADGGVH
jgi:vancomycin resistance protein YoaR